MSSESSATITENNVRSLNWEHICKYTPWVILGYFVIHYTLRVLISPNLEVDEAQFVGATDFKLLYGNSHPALYNWLVRLFLEATGWNWGAALPLLKNTLLAGTYLLGYDLIRRVTKSNVSATIAAIGLLLLPQIVWQSQITLAHSVMVAFGAVAALHAATLVIERGKLIDYLWLGTALAIGTLSKFHFLLVVLSTITAFLISPFVRQTLHKGKALLSLLVFAILVAPSLGAAALNLKQSTERLNKLYKITEASRNFDIPYLGIDGFVSLLTAVLASLSLLLIVSIIIYLQHRPASIQKEYEESSLRKNAARLFGWIAVFNIGIFALIVLLGDMHFVHERYLTPLLMPIPFFLVAYYQLEKNTRLIKGMAILGTVIMFAAILGVNSVIIFGKHSLAYPYQQFSAGLEKRYGKNLNLVTVRGREFGNLSIHMTNARRIGNNDTPDYVIVVWRHTHRVKGTVEKLGNKYKPAEPIFEQKGTYLYSSKDKVSMFSQKFIRQP